MSFLALVHSAAAEATASHSGINSTAAKAAKAGKKVTKHKDKSSKQAAAKDVPLPRARPDASSVIHSHPRYSVALSASGRPLGCYSQPAALFFDALGVYDGTIALIRSPDLGKAVAVALNQAEKYGTPMGQALRVTATENRESRMADAERKAAAADRRVSQATVTAKGKAMTDAVDRARERLVGAMFATWDDRDVEELVRLMGKFAGALTGNIRVGLP